MLVWEGDCNACEVPPGWSRTLLIFCDCSPRSKCSSFSLKLNSSIQWAFNDTFCIRCIILPAIARPWKLHSTKTFSSANYKPKRWLIFYQTWCWCSEAKDKKKGSGWDFPPFFFLIRFGSDWITFTTEQRLGYLSKPLIIMQGHLRSFAHANAREHKHIQLRRIWLWSFRIFHLCLSLPQAWEQAIDSPGNQQLIRCGECRHVWSYSSLKSHLHILLPPPQPPYLRCCDRAQGTSSGPPSPCSSQAKMLWWSAVSTARCWGEEKKTKKTALLALPEHRREELNFHDTLLLFSYTTAV